MEKSKALLVVLLCIFTMASLFSPTVHAQFSPSLDPNLNSYKVAYSATVPSVTGISTSKPNDIIYAILVTENHGLTFNLPTGGGLTWISRDPGNFPNSANGQLGAWYAISTLTQSGLTVTFSVLGGATGGAIGMVYSVCDVDTSSPFDGAASAASNDGVPFAWNKNTNNVYDLLVVAGVIQANKAMIAGSSYTLFNSIQDSLSGADEWIQAPAPSTYNVNFQTDVQGIKCESNVSGISCVCV